MFVASRHSTVIYVNDDVRLRPRGGFFSCRRGCFSALLLFRFLCVRVVSSQFENEAVSDDG